MSSNKVVIKFLGAAGTVTGSKYLVSALGIKILIDCGLFQGVKNLRDLNWDSLPLKATSIDKVLLTHGHLDHCGYLPRLVKAGFTGNIEATAPALDIAEIVLKDSAHIQEEDAIRANKEGYSKHKKALPLYTVKDVEHTVTLFQHVQTDEWIKMAKDFSYRFQYVGHILGATFIELDIKGKRFVFSGDVGRESDLLMYEPHKPDKADVLMIESTYGDRLHPNIDEKEKLSKLVNETYHKGGNIIIPSFAVERTQTLMFLLWQLVAEKRIPHLPMIMDSPMGSSVLNVFRQYKDWHKLSLSDCERMIDAFRVVKEYPETMEIIQDKNPKLIIAGSGMVSGGRVLTYLREYIGDNRTTVLLAGYQAEGTRGRQLLEGAREIKFFGKYYAVNARIEQMQTLSGHADQGELIRWMQNIKTKRPKVYITHGEPGAADAMRVKINDTYGWDALVPVMNDAVEVELP